MPPGKNPPPVPLGLSFSGLLSMLQSWGRSTARQDASANEGASAPLGSPRKNFHPASAARSCRGEMAVAATSVIGAKHASVALMAMRGRDEKFMRTSSWFLVVWFSVLWRSGARDPWVGHSAREGVCERFREKGGPRDVRIPARLCFPAKQ